jgi:hypothetical protein
MSQRTAFIDVGAANCNKQYNYLLTLSTNTAPQS